MLCRTTSPHQARTICLCLTRLAQTSPYSLHPLTYQSQPICHVERSEASPKSSIRLSVPHENLVANLPATPDSLSLQGHKSLCAIPGMSQLTHSSYLIPVHSLKLLPPFAPAIHWLYHLCVRQQCTSCHWSLRHGLIKICSVDNLANPV